MATSLIESIGDNIPIFPYSGFKDSDECIGRGGFGEVYKAHHDELGLVALKTPIASGDLPRREAECFKKEAKILHALQHPCIVKLVGLIMERDNYSLVLEFVHFGSITDFLADYPGMVKLPIKIKFLRDISSAMDYLHSQDPVVLHLDLKADNILIDQRFRAKVSDFGLCKMKTKSKTLTQCLQKMKCTFSHTAPEKWSNINTSPQANQDVYAFSLTLWEIYTEDRPYEGSSGEEIKRAVLDVQRPSLEKFLSRTRQEEYLKDIMEKCWCQQPDQRPSFKDINKDIEKLFQEITTGTFYEAVDELIVNNKQLSEVTSRDIIMEEYRIFHNSRESTLAGRSESISWSPTSDVTTDAVSCPEGPIQRATVTEEFTDEKELINPIYNREPIGVHQNTNNSNNTANTTTGSITVDLQLARHQELKNSAGRKSRKDNRVTSKILSLCKTSYISGHPRAVSPGIPDERLSSVGSSLSTIDLHQNDTENSGHAAGPQNFIPSVVDDIMISPQPLNNMSLLSNMNVVHGTTSSASSTTLAATSSNSSAQDLHQTTYKSIALLNESPQVETQQLLTNAPQKLNNGNVQDKFDALPNENAPEEGKKPINLANTKNVSISSEKDNSVPEFEEQQSLIQQPKEGMLSTQKKMNPGNSSTSSASLDRTQNVPTNAPRTQLKLNIGNAKGKVDVLVNKTASEAAAKMNSPTNQKMDDSRKVSTISQTDVFSSKFEAPKPLTHAHQVIPLNTQKELNQGHSTTELPSMQRSASQVPADDSLQKLCSEILKTDTLDSLQLQQVLLATLQKSPTDTNTHDSRGMSPASSGGSPAQQQQMYSAWSQSHLGNANNSVIQTDASKVTTTPSSSSSSERRVLQPTHLHGNNPDVTPEQPRFYHRHSGGGTTEISGLQGNIHSLSIGDHNTINVNTISPVKTNTRQLWADRNLTDSTRTLNNEDKTLIKDNIGHEWKDFARRLGLTDTEIDVIDHDYDTDGLREKVHQVIIKWENKLAAQANVTNLAAVLFSLGKKDVAYKMQ